MVRMSRFMTTTALLRSDSDCIPPEKFLRFKQLILNLLLQWLPMVAFLTCPAAVWIAEQPFSFIAPMGPLRSRLALNLILKQVFMQLSLRNPIATYMLRTGTLFLGPRLSRGACRPRRRFIIGPSKMQVTGCIVSLMLQLAMFWV